MILVFGSLNVDLVARVAVIPGPGKTVLAPSYTTHHGGKGANQAVAAARIAGPGKVRMAGRVGRDGFGDGALQNLIANGVDTGLIVRADEPTGCAFITVDPGGENAITVASGANMAASVADLPAALFGSDTVLVLQMEVPFAGSLEVARRTKSASGIAIWNLAPVPEQMSSAMLRDLLDSTDYLLVNEHEALDAAATLGIAMSDFEAAADRLCRDRRPDLRRDRGRAGRLRSDPRRRRTARACPDHSPCRHHGRRRHLHRSVCSHAERAGAAAKRP